MTEQERRELDAAVARALGWERVQWNCGFLHGLPPEARDRTLHTVPRFAAEVAAAWSVVEALRAREWLFECREQAASPAWCVVFAGPERAPFAAGDTLPEAICKAALKVAGEEARDAAT